MSPPLADALETYLSSVTPTGLVAYNMSTLNQRGGADRFGVFQWRNLCTTADQNMTDELKSLAVKMGVSPRRFSSKTQLCQELERVSESYVNANPECAQSEDISLISGEAVRDLPMYRVMSHTVNGRTYCFDVSELAEFTESSMDKFRSGKQVMEPYKRFVIDNDLIKKMNERIDWIQKNLGEAAFDEMPLKVSERPVPVDYKGSPIDYVPVSMAGFSKAILEGIGYSEEQVDPSALYLLKRNQIIYLLEFVLDYLSPVMPLSQRTMRLFERALTSKSFNDLETTVEPLLEYLFFAMYATPDMKQVLRAVMDDMLQDNVSIPTTVHEPSPYALHLEALSSSHNRVLTELKTLIGPSNLDPITDTPESALVTRLANTVRNSLFPVHEPSDFIKQTLLSDLLEQIHYVAWMSIIDYLKDLVTEHPDMIMVVRTMINRIL